MRTKLNRRRGFTFVDVLVVLFILGFLVAILTPAIQKARTASTRTTCANNMRQMGIALHCYHDANKYFPSSGMILDAKGKDFGFCSQSTMTWILPYMEHKDIYDQFADRRLPYNFKGKVKDNEIDNTKAAKNVINEYLCPTNPFRPRSGHDTKGFGYCDYMPIAYSNLTDSNEKGKPTTQEAGIKNKGIPLGSKDNFGNWPGALSCNYASNITGSSDDIFQKELFEKGPIVGECLAIDAKKKENKGFCWADGSRGANHGDVTDGLAHTIGIVEDVGACETFGSTSVEDPIEGRDNAGGTIPDANKVKDHYRRATWRWAEPAIADGVSGPNNAKADAKLVGEKGVRPINNFNTPIGGPPECQWTVENCGPRKEPFSFHNGGCNSLFMDGHVSFLKENINFSTMHLLLTPIEGVAIDVNDF